MYHNGIRGYFMGGVETVNIFARIWCAIWDDDLQDCKDEPGEYCRWIEYSVRCRAPLDEGNNWPSGCDARCPARLANERAAEHKEYENTVRLYI